MTRQLPLHLRPCPDAYVVAGFEVICIGGKLSIDGQGHLPHATCGGTGYQFPMLGQECPKCHGKGSGWIGRYDSPRVMECPECAGIGHIANYTVAALALARKTLNAVQCELFMTSLVGPWKGARAAMEWFLNLTEDKRIGYLKATLEAATEE